MKESSIRDIMIFFGCSYERAETFFEIASAEKRNVPISCEEMKRCKKIAEKLNGK